MEELERIRAEYRRRAREVPRDYYALSSAGHCRMVRERDARALARITAALGSLRGREVLDVGCGAGDWLRVLEPAGLDPKRYHGIELDENRFRDGAARFPDSDLRQGDASHLPWPDAFFDLVLQATLFTSILDPDFKRRIAAEMMRVLKPGGVILWYDFRCNNPWNPNVRGIGKREIKELFHGMDVRFETLTLAPPLVRFFAPRLESVCVFLEKIPFLRTHYLVVMRRRA